MKWFSMYWPLASQRTSPSNFLKSILHEDVDIIGFLKHPVGPEEYAEHLIVVKFVFVLKMLTSNNWSLPADLRVLVSLGRSGRLKGTCPPIFIKNAWHDNES